MPYTLAAYALTTVEFVKLVGGKEDLDSEQDQAIIVFTNAASRAVAKECKREFVADDYETGTRRFVFHGAGYVSFGRYDLQSISLLQIDADTTAPITIASDQYQMHPVDKPFGVWTYMKTNTAYYNRRYSSFTQAAPFLGPMVGLGGMDRTVDVTGTWGWPQPIHEDIQMATAMTVLDWLQRNQETFSSTFNIDTGRFVVPSSIPAGPRNMLEPFTKRLA
jgi:hypothetical protein